MNTPETHIEYSCPGCGTTPMVAFYYVRQVPVHSVLLLESRAEAVSYPKGDILLVYCTNCGFITNATFDPDSHDYSAKYEATQTYSPTFNRFHEKLARDLIERYDLRKKEIVEIGCGQGEFLSLLCKLGDNHGTGFDPAYRQNSHNSGNSQMEVISDFYSEAYAQTKSDFICCKMTLEHIQNTGAFIKMIRNSIDGGDAVVFFQVPAVERILRELAFWDIYYEHCSYFSRASLSYLFELNDFQVMDAWHDYDNQYLMIVGKPGGDGPTGKPPEKTELNKLLSEINHFAANHQNKIKEWSRLIDDYATKRKRIVIWGSSSKTVAFLTTLNITDEIKYVVDINPNRQNTYMAGTGQKIVPPEFLYDYQPSAVIVMNPIYRKEIAQKLRDLGVKAKLYCI